MLTAAWLRRNAASFDLVHVHFGTENTPVQELRDVVLALRELGRPLVHTVHDLELPHAADPGLHRARTALLVDAADELLTLTERAADAVHRRHGRRPVVVPHPQLAADAQVVAADRERVLRRRPDGPRVGVHVRSLRANVRAAAWLGALAEAVRTRGGTTVVFVNDDVRPGTAGGEELAALTAIARRCPVDLVQRRRPDDDALVAELSSLDVSVLPYTHGTHSGWLELCWDLGIGTLVPPCGAFGDQHPGSPTVQPFDPARPRTLGDALDRLRDAGPPLDADRRLAARRAVRDENHAAHRAAYRRALARSAGRGSGA